MINRICQTDFGSTASSTNRADHQPSIGSLLKDLADESRTLFRQEMELAKAEISEKVSTVGRNVAYLAVGGLIAYAGLLALIAAACVGLAVALSQVMDDSIASWLGPLIVGVVVALIGYAFAQKGISTLKNESFVPRKTMDSLRENKEWFKDQMKTSENRIDQQVGTTP
jgi:hypothetical protein